jgi:hypothetical protein
LASTDSSAWQGDYWNPIGVALGLFGGTRFTLSQTQPSFRPRDARDPAAYCNQADAAGQTHDGDCHPQFTATLTGLESYAPSLAGVISPSIAFTLTAATPLAPAGTWLQGTSTNYGTDDVTVPDYLFDLNAQPAQSKPLLAVQNPLAMQTNAGSIQTGTVYGGDPNDSDGVPSPMVSIPITVTSQDFGGKAYLRAALTLGPGAAPIDAEIVDPAQFVANPTTGQVVAVDVVPPVDNKPVGQPAIGTCGTDFAAHPFASLPVDQDCNGIADSWEDAHSPQTDALGNVLRDSSGNILHLPIDWDQEPGYDGTTVGDGYSVHDEYRGFHYIQDTVDTADPNNPNGVVQWASTDPVNTQDVFFWDSAIADPLATVGSLDPCTTMTRPLAANCLTTALRSLLATQTVNASGNQFMTFRRVNKFQANAYSLFDASQGVQKLNRNTIGASRGFAVVYTSRPDVPPTDGAWAQCDASPPNLGTLGYAFGSFQNNGQGFVDVNLPQASACAFAGRDSTAPTASYPFDALLPIIVAHETGHVFGLYHLYRAVTYQGSVSSAMSGSPSPTFALLMG